MLNQPTSQERLDDRLIDRRRVLRVGAALTGDEMVAAMDKVGVNGAIYNSPFSMYEYDASYALGVQKVHPDQVRAG